MGEEEEASEETGAARQAPSSIGGGLFLRSLRDLLFKKIDHWAGFHRGHAVHSPPANFAASRLHRQKTREGP